LYSVSNPIIPAQQKHVDIVIEARLTQHIQQHDSLLGLQQCHVRTQHGAKRDTGHASMLGLSATNELQGTLLTG